MSSAGAVGELILPRRVLPQPVPHFVTLGDCGACVLGGILNVPVDRIYQDLVGQLHALTLAEMARVIRVACYRCLADRVIESPAEWPSAGYADRTFGRPAYREALAWFSYVRMAIDAGYYGATIINTTGGAHDMGNHWVMICGARNRGPTAYNNTITGEVLISDSRSGIYPEVEWVEVSELLKTRGGYESLFVRPVIDSSWEDTTR